MKKTDLVYVLICGSLAVDSLNGYLLRDYSVSISPLYKAVILLACFFYVRSLFGYLAIVAVFAAFVVAHTVQVDGAELARSLDWMIKFLYIYVLFVFMRRDAKEGRLDRISWVAITSFLIIASNMILGVFGFGYPQYQMNGEGIGTRGFFYAGNEVSAALVCAAGIVMARLSVESSASRYFAFSFAAIAVAALTTMKTSVLATVVLFAIFPLINPRGARSVYKVSAKKMVAIAGAPVVFGVSLYYVLFDSDLISRLSYFYEKNGLVSLVFSQRNIWAVDALGIFGGYSFEQLLFGRGLSWVDEMPHTGTVEIDPVDVLMTYGLVGLFVVYGFIFSVVFCAARNRASDIARHVFLLVLLVVFISFTAGHVVFSGIAGPLIASVLALGFYVPRNRLVSAEVW